MQTILEDHEGYDLNITYTRRIDNDKLSQASLIAGFGYYPLIIIYIVLTQRNFSKFLFITSEMILIITLILLLILTLEYSIFYGYILAANILMIQITSPMDMAISITVASIIWIIYTIGFYIKQAEDPLLYSLNDFLNHGIEKQTPIVLISLFAGYAMDSKHRDIYLKTESIKKQRIAIQTEQDRNKELVSLPKIILDGLQEPPFKAPVLDAFGTVLYADIVSFTVFSGTVEAFNLVQILDDMFEMHDVLANSLKIDKVKTLGDCYVACTGVLNPIANHAATMVKFGLGMHWNMEKLNVKWDLKDKGPFGKDLRIRVGMASGPAVGGVVGGKKYIFDLWGSVVEQAELMESGGIPERVQVSHSTWLRSQKDPALSFQRRPEKVDGADGPSYLVDIPSEGVPNFLVKITGDETFGRIRSETDETKITLDHGITSPPNMRGTVKGARQGIRSLELTPVHKIGVNSTSTYDSQANSQQEVESKSPPPPPSSNNVESDQNKIFQQQRNRSSSLQSIAEDENKEKYNKNGDKEAIGSFDTASGSNQHRSLDDQMRPSELNLFNTENGSFKSQKSSVKIVAQLDEPTMDNLTFKAHPVDRSFKEITAEEKAMEATTGDDDVYHTSTASMLQKENENENPMLKQLELKNKQKRENRRARRFDSMQSLPGDDEEEQQQEEEEKQKEGDEETYPFDENEDVDFHPPPLAAPPPPLSPPPRPPPTTSDGNKDVNLPQSLPPMIPMIPETTIVTGKERKSRMTWMEQSLKKGESQKWSFSTTEPKPVESPVEVTANNEVTANQPPPASLPVVRAIRERERKEQEEMTKDDSNTEILTLIIEDTLDARPEKIANITRKAPPPVPSPVRRVIREQKDQQALAPEQQQSLSLPLSSHQEGTAIDSTAPTTTTNNYLRVLPPPPPVPVSPAEHRAVRLHAELTKMQDEHESIDARLAQAHEMSKILQDEMSKKTVPTTQRTTPKRRIVLREVDSVERGGAAIDSASMTPVSKSNTPKRVKVRELGRHNTPIHLYEAAARVQQMRSFMSDTSPRSNSKGGDEKHATN